MSASIPTSHEAFLSHASNPAPQATTDRSPHSEFATQFGVDAGSRLYEFWNAIFARAGVSADEPPPAAPRRSSTRIASDVGQSSNPVQTSGQWRFAAGNAVLQPTSTYLIHGSSTGLAATQFPTLVAEAHPSGSTSHVESPPGNALTRESAVSSDPDGGEPAHARTVSSSPKEQLTSPQSSTVSDSVSVFLNGAGVSIVVRDAMISPREAVACAFETARQLTGQRSALLRVTLNGQPLYRQQPPASQGQPALLFAC